ncbi:MAG: Transcriptional regulator Bxe_A0631, LysR family [uncultured Paraburkholderia sp.]|nr:MAG: Transcriptional regulator Bxe_A0631, LysR family [uncultured Paraburkholderia sp.]CAH2793427.1 MAG: Transcriptional regulator Bxe_A0631, LysR family [uncultured Paraburkholderia sp.]CAH2928272.1 MAG: Transcriptional regulator Bxe_A0631, LysR family [uncultured Paraburkholderia sp.]CAH2929988.1 MAG: Transcriptional regulator Bxe_A0631, LysR family [uncultured Paraburkholderia sp.]
MAPRVRVLLDFLSERFAQVSDELESLLGLPPAGQDGGAGRSVRWRAARAAGPRPSAEAGHEPLSAEVL